MNTRVRALAEGAESSPTSSARPTIRDHARLIVTSRMLQAIECERRATREAQPAPVLGWLNALARVAEDRNIPSHVWMGFHERRCDGCTHITRRGREVGPS